MSAKEKQASTVDEKDKDTSQKTPPSSPKAKSKSGSKPASRTTTPSKSPRPGSKASKKKGGKDAKKKEEKVETPLPTEEEESLPEGAHAIFLSAQTQELFHCRVDEDVTMENPIKIIPKQDILDDMRNRAAVCDFSVFKPQIQAYDGDELLIVYDYDFKWGQNFYIALNEETKEKILNPPSDHDGLQSAAAEEEIVVHKYVPPEPKDWVSLGSEKEIDETKIVENRGRIKVSFKRLRKEFGAPCSFKDRNVGDAKDGYMECTPYEDRSFDLKRTELEKGIQSVPDFKDTGCQTDWKYPRTAVTQYCAREFNEEEKTKILNSKSLKNFVDDCMPRFELALQQNEIMNIFYIDWLHLGDAENTLGSKADNHLKEYQSFTDLQFSKAKKITDIQWHPSIKGVVAVSVAERMTFDERIDNAAKVIMTPSLILIWSFADPIHPQLLLEAPDDINCFQFSPSDANIIVGGCHNGQVVLWDISAHADKLKQPRGGKGHKSSGTLPGFEDENALKTPVVRYCGVSSIENSHRAPITDITWVPDHMEVNRMGEPKENRMMQSCQVMTCATDHCVLFWDTRAPSKGPSLHHVKDDDKGPKNPMGVPNTFRHLDLSWKPLLKVTLHKSEPGGDHAPTKFSIQEKQGDRNSLNTAQESKSDKSANTMQGGFSGFNKPGSGKEKRTLNDVVTHFYVGTEDGEMVYADWMPQKDADTGKIQTMKPNYYHSLHDGPVTTVQRSPFFKDIILSVGGWTLCLWKEGVSSGPFLSSAASTVRLTCGYWSPTRPGVFFIAKVDGSVDVWDLLDKTHEASMSQSVSPAPITSIYPFQVTQKQQLLAVGDTHGTLHILEIPWSLRQTTSSEMVGVSNYFEREVKRRAFVVSRWDFRETEKRELEKEAKLKAGIAPNITLTEEEIQHKLQQEYHAYLEDEAAFLRELGLKVEEDEPLPEV